MPDANLATTAAVSLIGALLTASAPAIPGADAEIRALKPQLRLMKQKLDEL